MSYELELVGIAGGQLWHTIRNADGSWQPFFGLIETQESNNPGPFTAISAAGVGVASSGTSITGNSRQPRDIDPVSPGHTPMHSSSKDAEKYS